MIIDIDPLALAYLLAREKAHNAPLCATGGAGGAHMALHRADGAWQAIGCRVLAVAPETPDSDLVGLAARGQATQPTPRAPRTCWTCRSACADGSGCSYVGVMEAPRRMWCSAAAGNLDPNTELPLPGAAPCPAFVGRA